MRVAIIGTVLLLAGGAAVAAGVLPVADDTTAVLLTPVVVGVVRQCGLPALPFALMTVWLANTASLLLRISNLTNLLAQHTLGGISPAGFAALMWAPALAGVLVPLVGARAAPAPVTRARARRGTGRSWASRNTGGW